MENFKLPHSGHNKHLCYLVNLGVQQREPKMFKKLVKEPEYFCKLCGRVASKPRNLCKPVKL
ncbi:MAG: hypothetical protein ACYSSI_14410 [Planctomycetota bacterium]|jgi:hypothetical protein